jgi:hypothetical protein
MIQFMAQDQESHLESRPCPNCGFVYQADINDSETTCPGCSAHHFRKQFEARMLPFDTSGVIHMPQSDREAIRYWEGGKRAGSVDVSPIGRVDRSVSAGRKQGDWSSDLEVCNILTARLNQDGAAWGSCKFGENEDTDVDCIAFDSRKNALRLQVTKPATEAVWSSLRKAGQTIDSKLVSVAVNELRDSIEKKANLYPLEQRERLVLALNAIETAEFVTSVVVASFRAEFGAWARTLKFEAIWVVGPNEALTFRLDH